MPDSAIPSIETQFPLAITILAYVATGALILIFFILLSIQSRLTTIAAKLSSKSSSSATRKVSSEESDEPEMAEPEPGSPFDNFLKEDPQRRSLTKKEQSKAYRRWRADRGLNWSKPAGER